MRRSASLQVSISESRLYHHLPLVSLCEMPTIPRSELLRRAATRRNLQNKGRSFIFFYARISLRDNEGSI